MTYQDVLRIKNEDFSLELTIKAIENIENSRKTMENASKAGLEKLSKANQGFLAKNKTIVNGNVDWRKQQLMLLKSNLNGIGKSLKPDTVRYFFLLKQ